MAYGARKTGSSVSSNRVILNYISENAAGACDTTADRWRGMLVTAPSTFGETLGSIDAEDLTPTSQNSEPSVVSADAAAGFTANLRPSNILCFLMGLFRNLFDERGTTNQLVPKTGSAKPTVAAVVSDGFTTTNTTTANGFPAVSDYELLIYADGFKAAGNNGVFAITTVANNKLTVKTGDQSKLSTTATSGDLGSLTVVGVRDSSAVAWDVSDLKLTGVEAAGTLGIKVGDWLKFTIGSNNGWSYGRVASTSTANKEIVFSKFIAGSSAWNADIAKGTDVSNILFSVRSVSNPTTEAQIRDTSYCLELVTPGKRDGSDTKEVVTARGSLVNTATLSTAARARASVAMEFLPTSAQTSTKQSSTNVLPEKQEAFFNTSSDVPVIRLYDSDGKDLFVNVSDITLTFNNNITGVPGIGTQRFVDVIHGNFSLEISGTALFTNYRAKEIAQANETISAVVFFDNKDGGHAIDIPALKVTTADGVYALNTPVNITLATSGFKSDAGYTARWETFVNTTTV